MQVQLEEAQQDLKDTEYDKWISDTEDMLDDLSDEMEGFFENLMNKPNELLANIQAAIENNPALIADALAKYGLGDAHSFDTVTNPDGSKTTNSTDYGNNSYQNSYDQNGVSTNNNYNSTITPGNPNYGNSSDKTETTSNMKSYDDVIKYISEHTKSMTPPAEKKNYTGLNDVIYGSKGVAMTLEDQSKVYEALKSLTGKNTIPEVMSAIAGNGFMGQLMSTSLNSSSIISPTTDKKTYATLSAIQKYMKSNESVKLAISDIAHRQATDPFFKYLLKAYSPKVVSYSGEAAIANAMMKDLGSNFVYRADDFNDNKTGSAHVKGYGEKLVELLKNLRSTAGFSSGGIGKLIKATGEDGIALVRNGEGFVKPEDVAQMKEFMNVLPVANNLMDNLVPLHNMPLPISNKANNPVSIGDVNVHLDGSNVVDPQSFVDTFKQSSPMQRAIKDCVASDFAKSYSNTLGRF